MTTYRGEIQPVIETDEQIVAKILAGEQRLYERIIRKYNSRLYRIGMAMLNNDHDVEEIMQIAYIKAFEHLAGFGNRSAFGTWLTRIFINEGLQYLKGRKKQPQMEIDQVPLPNSGHTPVKALLNKELKNALEDAIIRLPEKYRMVFVLREMENLSSAETGETLQITETNVKVRLNRAKSMLRNSLEQYYKSDAVFPFHRARCDRMVNDVMTHIERRGA